MDDYQAKYAERVRRIIRDGLSSLGCPEQDLPPERILERWAAKWSEGHARHAVEITTEVIRRAYAQAPFERQRRLIRPSIGPRFMKIVQRLEKQGLVPGVGIKWKKDVDTWELLP